MGLRRPTWRTLMVNHTPRSARIARHVAYYLYIMVSAGGTLYVGVTNDLFRRAVQHALAGRETFAGKYHVNRLVYVECFDSPLDAFRREEQIKCWRREKNVVLID